MRKAELPVKSPESLIPLHYIKPDHVLEFAQADRTEVQGAGIALLEMIGPIHNASEKNAVFQ